MDGTVTAAAAAVYLYYLVPRACDSPAALYLAPCALYVVVTGNRFRDLVSSNAGAAALIKGEGRQVPYMPYAIHACFYDFLGVIYE